MEGKDLRTEVQNYTKTYGEILVGIHNDLIDYKNKVNIYSKKSTTTLSKCTKLLNLSEDLKDSTLETYKKIEKSALKINDQLKEFLKKFNEYQVYLKNHEEELQKKLVSLDKSNNEFKKGIEIIDKISLDNLNLKESMWSIEARLNREDLNLKASIESLENKLADTQNSLILKEKQIMKLENYKFIFVFALSLLFILIIISVFG